ncbi:MAG: hypothetical protein EXS10_09895 [Phycisphaerales bacterium]|nr:hypothetical protein [Phycisphaerales bacterium]
MENDALFEEIGQPWIVDSSWTVRRAPAFFARESNGAGVRHFFSRESVQERAAQLAQVPDTGRRWLLEVAFGQTCITSLERYIDASTPSRLFAVRFFPTGGLHNCPQEVASLAHPCLHANFGELSRLTRRELEIFRMLGAGCSNEEMAKGISRTIRLVESIGLRLRVRLGGATLRAVIARSARSGLHSLSEPHWSQILAHRHATKPRGMLMPSPHRDGSGASEVTHER